MTDVQKVALIAVMAVIDMALIVAIVVNVSQVVRTLKEAAHIRARREELDDIRRSLSSKVED